MASSNEMLQYKDLTPAPRLDNKTLNKVVWRSCQLQACFNYERMQAAGWLWSILPGLQKIHTNKDDLAASMTHNLDFLNTHPFACTFVMGMVLSMEQQKMDIQTIRSVRISVAAPLGGIGDALFWMTLIPIVAGMTAQMAIDGSWVGPILYFVIAFGVEMALRYGLMYWSYNMGTKAVAMMTVGGVAVSPALQSFADNYTWVMAGLGAAGGMMRFVGFSILMKIMMAADMWGWLLAGFAMALLFGNVEATASAALILVAFIGIAIALLDFRINSLAKTAEGGMSDGI